MFAPAPCVALCHLSPVIADVIKKDHTGEPNVAPDMLLAICHDISAHDLSESEVSELQARELGRVPMPGCNYLDHPEHLLRLAPDRAGPDARAGLDPRPTQASRQTGTDERPHSGLGSQGASPSYGSTGHSRLCLAWLSAGPGRACTCGVLATAWSSGQGLRICSYSARQRPADAPASRSPVAGRLLASTSSCARSMDPPPPPPPPPLPCLLLVVILLR